MLHVNFSALHVMEFCYLLETFKSKYIVLYLQLRKVVAPWYLGAVLAVAGGLLRCRCAVGILRWSIAYLGVSRFSQF